jgi:hypothetical protein
VLLAFLPRKEKEVSEQYAGEYADLVRDNGYARTFEIIQERERAARQPPEPGDAYEGTIEEWQKAIESNRRPSP